MHMQPFNICTLCSVLKVYRDIVYKMCSLCITGTILLTLKAAVNELLPVSHKWFRIGLQLGVPGIRLETIQTDTSGAMNGLQAMLHYWMNNTTDTLPSWKVLVNALRAPDIGERKLARELEERYCNPEYHSSLGEREAI